MAGKGKPKTKPAQIEAEERQAAAVNLRKCGVTFEEIARQVGYASASGAYEAVKSAMAKTLREPADDLRQLELARLDTMLEAISENILAGDLDAIATALRISERRSRLLGLDMRERALSVNLPKMDNVGNGLSMIGVLIAKAAKGELLPDEAAKLAGLVQTYAKVAETTELEDRISRLEDCQLNNNTTREDAI